MDYESEGLRRFGLGFFLVVFFVGLGGFVGFIVFVCFVFGNFFHFGGSSGSSSRSGRSSRLGRSGWLGVSDRGGDGIAFGGESGIALDEEDDAFDEAPDTTTHDGDIGEEHEKTEEDTHDRDVGGQSDHDGGKDDKEEAATSQSDVKDAFFVFAEIPVVGAERTEENAKQASDDRRFNAGGHGVLDVEIRGGRSGAGGRVGVWVGILVGVWVHKISLVI